MDFDLKDIRQLSMSELESFLVGMGEKKFRATQLCEWIWKKGAESFEEMSNIPKPLRDKLSEIFRFANVACVYSVASVDGTCKFLFETADCCRFEGVLIPSADRVTACISTQVGCQMGCAFCATGQLGFKRNLTSGEIFHQVFSLNRLSSEIFGFPLSNIVIMGMGEPLMNYENTLAAINMICSSNSMGMSPQRITMSTCGIAPQIKRLADDAIRFNLSISLHSAIDSKRNEIMPINRKYNLALLSDAIQYFHAKTGSRITYEYLMLGGVNDSIDDARALTEFTKVSPCKINIIEYNPHPGDTFRRTNSDSLEKFIRHIESCNIVVTIRKSKGLDIAAACGQLANMKK
ncbi:MAG: 23S rRNA (adenine(2503)-C(2))-methyltransferase RlmN [Bacteroidales bacterium]|nr:23S rRNA (adenine(2503)-C(2))-methyltransferase RlmN [Bacteroidales bacterium]